MIKRIQDSVIELYSLLHQRFVLSEDGLEEMVVLIDVSECDRREKSMKAYMVVVLVCCVKGVR